MVRTGLRNRFIPRNLGSVPTRFAPAKWVDNLESRLFFSFAAHIDFQPAGSKTYPGYSADSGAVYGSRGNGLTYGWNVSAASSTVARNSGKSADQRYDTSIAMQTPVSDTWQIAVPNGQYTVHVVAGDANNYTSTDYRITAEGQLAVDAIPSSANRWAEGTVTVTVTDGRLTIANAANAKNNKICYVDITQLTPPTPPPVSGSTGTLGLNLGPVNDWSTDAPFVDVKNLFRRFGDYNAWWQKTTTIPLTADGYPLANAAAGASLLAYPDGIYHMSYQGTATVLLSGGATVSNIQHVGNAATGYTTADVTITQAKGPVVLQVSNIDRNNPFHNFHLIAPGYAYDPVNGPAQEFTNDFLRRVGAFSTIRAMDWFNTNNSPIKDWSQRTLPTSFTRTTFDDTASGGMAYEDLITLANATHSDVWINIPDQATSDFVHKLASLFAGTLDPNYKLDPSLTLHLEYSNETWNTQFTQYSRILALAKANPLVTATDDYSKVAQESAYKLKAAADIFKQEFTAAATGGQPVATVSAALAGQAAVTYFLQTQLAFLKANYGDPKAYISELAIAPYVGDPYSLPQGEQAGLTLDTLFSALNTELNTTVNSWIKAHAALASQYGLKLVAYEAGQSLEGTTNAAIKQAAQSDPRMGQLYQSLVKLWNADGGGAMNLYDYVGPYSTWGYWGLMDSATDAGSVKWDAALSLNLSAGDANLDGKVDYADFLILKADFGKTGQWWENGDFNADNVVDKQDFYLLSAKLTGLTAAQQADVNAFKLKVG